MRDWQRDPSSAFGWIVLGDETQSNTSLVCVQLVIRIADGGYTRVSQSFANRMAENFYRRPALHIDVVFTSQPSMAPTAFPTLTPTPVNDFAAQMDAASRGTTLPVVVAFLGAALLAVLVLLSFRWHRRRRELAIRKELEGRQNLEMPSFDPGAEGAVQPGPGPHQQPGAEAAAAAAASAGDFAVPEETGAMGSPRIYAAMQAYHDQGDAVEMNPAAVSVIDLPAAESGAPMVSVNDGEGPAGPAAGGAHVSASAGDWRTAFGTFGLDAPEEGNVYDDY